MIAYLPSWKGAAFGLVSIDDPKLHIGSGHFPTAGVVLSQHGLLVY